MLTHVVSNFIGVGGGRGDLFVGYLKNKRLSIFSNFKKIFRATQNKYLSIFFQWYKMRNPLSVFVM